MHRVYILSLLFCLFINASGQELLISEFMASNHTAVISEDNDAPDWIELYNASDDVLNLKDYYFTNRSDLKKSCRLDENLFIKPGKYVVLWADRRKGEKHLNFTIAKNGAYLGVFRKSWFKKHVVDSISYSKQRVDISYGRDTLLPESRFYFMHASPNSKNTTAYPSFVNSPQIYPHTGFYKDSVCVEMSVPDHPEVRIFYTLDGTEPNENSLQYTGPFQIARNVYFHPEEKLDDNQANQALPFGIVVNAIALNKNDLPSQIARSCYFINDDGKNPHQVPLISILSSDEDLFSQEYGIYAQGLDFDSTDVRTANYSKRGLEWERKADFSFLDDSILFSEQKAGIRIYGESTRSYPQKSLRLYARKSLGKSSFKTGALFEKQELFLKPKIDVRNAGNDQSVAHIRDALAVSIIKKFSDDYLDFIPSVVYINGKYWGLYNMKEHLSREYLAYHHAVSKKYIQLEENIKYGSFNNKSPLAALVLFPDKHDLSDEKSLRRLKQELNLDAYTDFLAANVCMGNSDWLFNNQKIYSIRKGGLKKYYKPWTFLYYDMDFCFGMKRNPCFNRLKTFLRTRQSKQTYLLRALLGDGEMPGNMEFRKQFLGRVCDFKSTYFSEASINWTLDSLIQIYAPEMEFQVERWKRPESIEKWNENIREIRDFSRINYECLFEQMMSMFEEAESKTEVSLKIDDNGYLKINSIPIAKSKPWVSENSEWTGIYFSGLRVCIEAIPYSGYEFDKWEGLESDLPVQVIDLTEDLDIKPVFRKVVVSKE